MWYVFQKVKDLDPYSHHESDCPVSYSRHLNKTLRRPRLRLDQSTHPYPTRPSGPLQEVLRTIHGK